MVGTKGMNVHESASTRFTGCPAGRTGRELISFGEFLAPRMSRFVFTPQNVISYFVIGIVGPLWMGSYVVLKPVARKTWGVLATEETALFAVALLFCAVALCALWRGPWIRDALIRAGRSRCGAVAVAIAAPVVALGLSIGVAVIAFAQAAPL
ncbi:MAG: hypothetical protein QM626_12250 [Microbacterium sp.]|uniref:hypothetical protein n=1 Tax=Microbacterium sp. TaxID=51671 RepID=UPI0039E27EB8